MRWNNGPDSLEVIGLDSRKCVIGDDAIALFGDHLTIYSWRTGTPELLGHFDGPANALAALDQLDLEAELTGESSVPTGPLALRS